MPKNNNFICDNIFRNKDNQERKQIFTQKISELINQKEQSSTVIIYKQDDRRYNNQADRLVFIESLNAQCAIGKRGDKA